MSLILFVPSFLGAFGVGEGLITLLGYDVGGAVRPPVGVGLLATVPALLVFAVPVLPCWYFARRARAQGRRFAEVPLWISVAIAVVFAVLNLVPLGQ